MLKSAIVVAAFAFALSGCVSANLSSMKDPTFTGPKIERLLVMTYGWKLDMRKEIENAFVSEAEDVGTVILKETDVIPPLREYSKDERRQIMEKNGIQGYLLFVPWGSETATFDVPLVSSSTTTGSASIRNNVVQGGSQTSTVSVGGRAQTVTTSITYKALLLQSTTGKTIWEGDVTVDFTNTSKAATRTSILSKVASEILKKLSEDQIIGKPSAVTGGQNNP
ncbi:MAG: hypothetical protein JSS89_13860 [Bacteroidetes bacterium]|nr:hypothetical protein [Bacteroidota bacterium]